MKYVKQLGNRNVAILLLLCLCSVGHALEPRYHYAGFYIKNFGGQVNPETLPQVYEVFQKVRAVAEVSNYNLPQLVIIKGLPGPPAIVLPDGNLVLAEKALEVVYGGVSSCEGDARLAFILGHELAHLASDDSWSTEVQQLLQTKALSGEIDNSLLKQIEQDTADLMEKELKADDKGFLYAAMAGFEVEALLTPENDFLSYWVAETHTQSSKVHPDAIERTKLLRMRLQQKKDALEFFHTGVRLAHFGRYQDAVYFFKEFQKVFPGREVFNNLGVCHLQMALKKLPPELAYQYWLPCTLDNETLIRQYDTLPIFRDRNQMPIARNFLKQAVRYFTIATEKDPAYATGYINQAVTYFYLNEIYKARAAVEEARRLRPDDYEIESLRALILSEEGQPMDTWSYAEEIFSSLAGSDSTDTLPLSVHYNWARLLEARGRSAESQWQTLEKHVDDLPLPIARMLCKKLEDPSLTKQSLEKVDTYRTNDGVEAFLKSLPVQPGFDSWKLKKDEHPLNNWQKLPFHWQGDAANSGIIYHNEKGSVVLEMDDVIEMVVLKQPQVQSEEALHKYGKPLYKKTVMNGELWSYGHWALLTERDTVRELWSVRDRL